ncbi:hypothetical protein Q1695_002494 [Nippostrongylus brasiliensis]|nr:hypothetical protein Q1695_002494 [Nippostrongylus brasiliensis]
MECAPNDGNMFNERSGGVPAVFHDRLEAISQEIPETFDLGTIAVELSCIAASEAYIIIGARCGALFVYNKRLGKLARPLRTDSFEAVTCIRHLHHRDDFVAVGHNTGTLVVIRLPSGREGASTSLAQCIDKDSHRRSAITCVEWNSDATQVVSCDASGTVIISTVIFDTGEFYHSFLFEGPSPVLAVGFLNDSVVIHNGLQLAVASTKPPTTCEVITDSEDSVAVLSLRCTDSFVYVVERTRICVYTTSFSICETIAADELGRDIASFRAATWDDNATVLAVLSSTNVFCLMDIVTRQILWTASSINGVVVGDFCLDSDGSILYITKPRGVHRIGITAAEKSLLEQEKRRSISSLLSSPRKFMSSGSLLTQKGVSLVSSAISSAKDIASNSEVPNILEDALSRMTIREDLNSLIQNVVDIIDPELDIREDSSQQSQEVASTERSYPPGTDYEGTEELPAVVSVIRKEKGRRHRQNSLSKSTNSTVPTTKPVDIDESALLALRRQVLGNTTLSGSPCDSGTGFNTTPSFTPGESPQMAAVICDSNFENANNSLTRDPLDFSNVISPPIETGSTVSPEMDSATAPSTSTGLSQSDDACIAPSTSAQGAESVIGAYEYLLNGDAAQLTSLELKDPSTVHSEGVRACNVATLGRARRPIVLNDRVDIWSKTCLQHSIKTFAVGREHVIVCHRKKNPRMVKLCDLDTKNPPWITTKWAADCVSLNDDESIIWIVRQKVALCAVQPLSGSTGFIECAEDGGGVQEVAVGRNFAWYITKEGVSLQMELPDKAIFSRVDRDWPLTSITVSEEAVWAIRSDTGSLVVRVGLARCKMGLDWVEITPEGPSKLVSACVYGSYGFVVDCSGQLWMTTGVDHKHPYGSSDAFYKICLPNLDAKSSTADCRVVKVSSAGLFLSTGKVMYLSRCALSGHKFPREIPTKYSILDNFSVISAGSFDGEQGSVHLCRENSEIFVYRPSKRNFITLSMPLGSCAIISLCATPQRLSLIDSRGQVFHCDAGTSEWTPEKGFSAAVCSLARSKLGSWAITCEGAILMKSHTSDKWLNIAPPSDLPADVFPSQVFTSPNGIYVWIFAGGRAWARSNINARNVSGVKWTETYHTSELCSLAVGDNVVWALDAAGRLLRLRGLAAGNPSGNYWRPIWGELFRAISIDDQSNLWALDIENHLVRHLSDVFVPDQFQNCDIRDSCEYV